MSSTTRVSSGVKIRLNFASLDLRVDSLYTYHARFYGANAAAGFKNSILW